MKIAVAAGLAFLFALAVGVQACAVSDRAVDFLEKTAPRAAGMGGAFTAVQGDPAGMFWNPSAAMRADRFAISLTHSLRHFPGPHKNLDQFDSDMLGVTAPLSGGAVLGAGFTLPGEWGVDYTDTNGGIPAREKLRGRERRFSYTDLDGSEQNGAAYLESDWYRYNNMDTGVGYQSFKTGGGFSFFYEDDNGMAYGVNVHGLNEIFKGVSKTKKAGVTATLGAAYRPDSNASTLAVADVELKWKDGFSARWFGGAERSFDGKTFLRVGAMDGMPTYGGGARFGSLRLDYAVVKNLMPEVSENKEVRKFGDGHFISYTLGL
jgi:hypothetical protein